MAGVHASRVSGRAPMRESMGRAKKDENEDRPPIHRVGESDGCRGANGDGGRGDANCAIEQPVWTKKGRAEMNQEIAGRLIMCRNRLQVKWGRKAVREMGDAKKTRAKASDANREEKVSVDLFRGGGKRVKNEPKTDEWEGDKK